MQWWEMFYTENELNKKLQMWNQDTLKTKLIRSLLFVGNILLVVFYLQYREITHMLLFFTNWTTWFTVFYFTIALVLQHSKKKSNSLLAIHHIFFQLAFVMNILVVVIYWPLLYKIDMQRPELIKSDFRRWLSRATHVFPCLSMCINL